MNLKKLAVLVFSMFALTSTQAQKKWTLKECVDYALENNLNIKQTGINAELARINYNQNFAAMFPSVNGSATQAYNYGRSINPSTNNYSNNQFNSLQGSISADVVIFNGLRLQNTLQQSKINYAAGKYDMDKIKNDIAMAAVANYLSVLYAKENLKAAIDRVAVTNSQRNNIKIQVDAGNMAQGNLLDLESQVAQEEVLLVNAETSLSQAFLTLTQIMNLDSVEGFDIDAPSTVIPDQSTVAMDPNAIYAVAETLMPEIKGSELRNQSAEKGIAIAKGSYYPRLSAFAQYGTNFSNQLRELNGAPVFNGYSPNGNVTVSGEEVFSPDYIINTRTTPFNTQYRNNRNQAWGLTLSVPIFNGLSARYGVARAKLNQQNINYQYDLQKQQLYKSIQQAHIDAVNTAKKYVAAQKSVTALKTSFSYTEKKLAVGMINTVDYTTIKNNLTKAESDLLQAKYELVFRIKVLDFYMGKPLM